MKSDKIYTVLAPIGTVLFLIFLLTLFLFVPYNIKNSESQIYPFEIGVFRYVGAVPIFIGVFFFLWSAWSLTFSGKGTPCPFYPPEEFVVSGIYRYVRNPMYVGGICILVGEALLFESTYIFLYAIGMFVFLNLFVIFEEGNLKKSFGKSYEQYYKSVPRWIPRLKPFRGDFSKSS